MPLQQVEQANPGLRALDLADHHQCMRVLATKPSQIRVRSQHGITQYARSDLIGQSDQSGDRKARRLLDDGDAGARMAAGTDQQNRHLAHWALAPASWELL